MLTPSMTISVAAELTLTEGVLPDPVAVAQALEGVTGSTSVNERLPPTKFVTEVLALT
jgi:hypothetical protein